MIDLIRQEIKEWDSESDVWQLLDDLAEDNYCLCSTDFTPNLEGETLYVLVSDREAVLVLKDGFFSDDGGELADEESFQGEPPLYFTIDSHRVSPVYKLREAACALRQSCRLSGRTAPRTLCMLLTRSTFRNAEDMERIWGLQNTIVVHEMGGLEHEIKENMDIFFSGGDMLTTYFEMKEKGKIDFTVNVVDEPVYEDYGDSGVFSYSAATGRRGGEGVGLCDAHGYPYDIESLLDEADLELADETAYMSGDGKIKMKKKLPAVQILEPLENAKEVLDGLVGLGNIKKHLADMTCLAQYNQRLKECFPEAQTHEVNLHGIFYGNVGVGKTTVGRIYGSLLHECGVLSKGHVVLANRGSFVGTRWGEEEINVRLAVKMAQGGVLMIDEAYLLVSDNRNDPGQLVLPQLLEILADEGNRDIAVLLCGYEKPLLNLLSTNPGLNSRFVNRYQFSDFTLNELLEISRRRVKKYDYEFTADAWRRYKAVLNDCYVKRNVSTWSNARFVANFLEQIYLRHAQRCVKSDINGKDLLKLRSADIPLQVAAQEKELRIGF